MEGYEVEHDFVGLGRRKMLLNARKLFYEEDTRSLILLAIEDVTERRAAQREAAELLQQKEMLLREMQHRVANSLQIIASILLLKARAVSSRGDRGHLQDAHRRVMSVAAVQQQLQASGHGEQIKVGPYLSRLCESLAASMIGDSRPVTLEVQAGDGRVSSDKAVSIGLIVTELVINALKHAFVDETKAGTILIAYEVAGTNWRLSDRRQRRRQDCGQTGTVGARPRHQHCRSARQAARQPCRDYRDGPARHHCVADPRHGRSPAPESRLTLLLY